MMWSSASRIRLLTRVRQIIFCRELGDGGGKIYEKYQFHDCSHVAQLCTRIDRTHRKHCKLDIMTHNYIGSIGCS